jgi:hypothetical protein
MRDLIVSVEFILRKLRAKMGNLAGLKLHLSSPVTSNKA